jgi:predicted RND superfamily exporter protein
MSESSVILLSVLFTLGISALVKEPLIVLSMQSEQLFGELRK